MDLSEGISYFSYPLPFTHHNFCQEYHGEVKTTQIRSLQVYLFKSTAQSESRLC